MDWPKGIKPRGRGLELTLWKGRRRIFNEIVPCDPYDPADLSAAVRRLDDKRARLRAGLPLHDDSSPDSPVFRDVAQRWLNSLQVSHDQMKLYTRYLNTYWMPVFGNWMAADIAQSHVKEVLAGMGVKIKTQKNRLGPLAGVLDHAGIHPNPAKGITWSKTRRKAEKPKIDRHRPSQRDRVITELDKLAAKYRSMAEEKPTGQNLSKAHWSAQATVYFPLLYATGMRPGGEPLGLDWPDYDGECLEVYKQRSDSKERDHTKTGEDRTVFVPEWVRPRLDSLSTRFVGDSLFTGIKGEALKYTDELNKIWAEALKKARLRHQEPYICRHTRAAELLSQGVEPLDAADQLGHSLQMFLHIYSELIDEYRNQRDMNRFQGVAPRQAKA